MGFPVRLKRRLGRCGTPSLLAAAALLLFSLPAFAQIVRIQEVRWEGLRRIPRDTMNARILSKAGDVYSPDVLKRDFQAVWNTNFFEDVRLEVEDGERGKIIYFIVVERPLIRRIEYEGVKSVQQSEILERFRERRVGLTVEMQYDPTRIRRAEVVLKELLSERGRHFAKVGHVPRRVPPNAVILTFVVEEGPKVKVGKISFQGNRYFSDRRLVRAMKNSRPYGIPMVLPLVSKTYHAGKISDDLERVRELYQEHGYFRIIVNPPDERIRDTEPQWPLGTLPWFFKPGKAVDMRIQLDEGGRYRMGKLTVKPATQGSRLFFRDEFLKAYFPLQEGDIFNAKKIREALENYRKVYGEFGFINMTTIPNTDIHDDERVINMELEFDEGKQFFVNRIEFVGNTTTRDKVIRRELLVEEGSVFNSRAWENSVLRLNQLGYFEELKPEHADIQQNAERGEVDLTLKVKERGKNTIGLTGGASGVLGSFIGLNYETNNFLGLGETLSVNIEWGDRQQGLVFGFTEPYVFDRPLTAGFSFFIRRFEFDQARETALVTGFRGNEFFASSLVNYIQDSIGFSVFGSYAPKRFRWTRLGLTYAYDVSDLNCVTEACDTLFRQLQFRSFAGPDALEGITSSRVTPSYYYSTVNHSIFPTRGTSLFAAFTFEGGPLGGNQKSFRPTLEWKHFRPINKGRNTLAFRLQAAFLTGFGGRSPSPTARYYTGGEDSIRGFDIRSISPMAYVPVRGTVPFFFLDPTRLDPQGNPTLRFTTVEVLSQTISFPGGDTQLIANFEYRIPIAGPVQIAPFADFGWNGVWRRSQLRLNPEGVEALQEVFPRVEFGDQLELVSDTNFRPRASVGLEMVVFVPILNVPFRVYWAYNALRLTESIVIPAAQFEVPEGVILPPGVFENQILPGLGVAFQRRSVRFDEPPKTFRFTVSRTF